MKIGTAATGEYHITASIDELRLINNCINDAMDLMEDAEFQTRTGASKSMARNLLEIIHSALRARQI